jgi:hypothetical protein
MTSATKPLPSNDPWYQIASALRFGLRGSTGVAKVFLSSTFQDLKDYRDAVYVALRRLGHESMSVEDWVASEQKPLERSLTDLRDSDVAVFLVAWRYGYVPPGQPYSVTELELRAARDANIPCLVFLSADDMLLTEADFDPDLTNIKRFRDYLREQYIVGYLSTPEALATEVALSLHRWVANGTRDLPPAGSMSTADELPGPEVFLSYAHEDIGMAKAVSERIGRERWSVFWDRTIPVGFTWDDIVEGALDAAKCVVVLWSPAARTSD